MKKLLLVLLVLLGLQTQAQTIYCDSVDYSIQTAWGTNALILNSYPNQFSTATVVNWDWHVCSIGNFCCYASGQTATFNQFNITDTLIVCLATILETNFLAWTCSRCDSLLYGPSGWMKVGFLVSVKEIEINTITNNKMYDLLGREFYNYNSIPKETMYIKNREKFIKK